MACLTDRKGKYIMKDKNVYSEKIAVGYESLGLSPEAQRYLETDGRNLIAAAMHREDWYGMPWDDLFQECMIAATRAIIRYNGAWYCTKMSTYITKAVEMAIRVERRRLASKKAATRRNEFSFEASEIIYDDSERMLDNIMRKSRVEWLDWAIGDSETGLTDEERQVLQYTRKGLSQTEISKAMGFVQSEVSKRKTRAVQKLRDRLGKMIEEGTVTCV